MTPEVARNSAELSPEEMDAEVSARVSALTFATKDEISRAMSGTQSNSLPHYYLQAFDNNPTPRISREQVEKITAQKTTVDSNIIRATTNKTAYLKDQGLTINAEKDYTEARPQVVAWLLQSTRVLVLKTDKIPTTTLALHDAARSTLPSLSEPESFILECLLDQHIGVPLNHLANYAEIKPEQLEGFVKNINATLDPLNAKIHIRNGIAIIGTNQKNITAIDNANTRKNLFPKRKRPETPEEKLIKLQAELKDLQEKLAAETEARTSAETQLATTTRERNTLSTENAALNAKVEQLAADVEAALAISAEVAAGSKITELEAQLQSITEKLGQKSQEFSEVKTALRAKEKELITARSLEARLRQQVEALSTQVTRAEDARAEIQRARSRDLVPKDNLPDDVRRKLSILDSAVRDAATLRSLLQQERAKTTIHPEELARLRKAAGEANLLKDQLEKLKAIPNEGPQLAALKTEMAALTKEIDRLTAELLAANELLESASAPTPAPAPAPTKATQVPVPAPAHTPAPRPTPIIKTPTVSPLDQIKNGEFRGEEELVAKVKAALSLSIDGSHGLSKSKLRELRDTLTNLQFGRDSWMHEKRVAIVKALKSLQDKGSGNSIPTEAVEEFINSFT